MHKSQSQLIQFYEGFISFNRKWVIIHHQYPMLINTHWMKFMYLHNKWNTIMNIGKYRDVGNKWIHFTFDGKGNNKMIWWKEHKCLNIVSASANSEYIFERFTFIQLNCKSNKLCCSKFRFVATKSFAYVYDSIR